MQMISKSQEKLVRSLTRKKYRNQEGLFILEGEKLLNEALDSKFELEFLLATEAKAASLGLEDYTLIEERSLQKLSQLKTSPGIMALAKMKDLSIPEQGDLFLLLDQVKDPGNLGTIIRSAEAFGVSAIICSEQTVDQYNPKVVQASMGSIFRLPMRYEPLEDFLQKKSALNRYAIDLNGSSIYQGSLHKPALLLMGSESHGVSESLLAHVDECLTIPMQGKVESLNVSVATALALAAFQA
jgi:TrmH family RNA methyltransferase